MTQKKPTGMSFQSWIDQQIHQCQQTGGFDNLPGKGKPISGLKQPYDPDWWVKRKLQEEGLDATPTILKVKAKIERWQKSMSGIYAESMVRKQVQQLNIEIKEANGGVLGPLPPLKLLDVEALVAKWKLYNK